jgi:hypothetical protein
MANDYSGYEETAAPEQLQQLNNLATMLEAAELEAEELELKYKEAEKRATQLREQDIPSLMQSIGMKKIVTAAGLEIELREEVRASFFAKDKLKREPAFAWLRDHNHDGLIKNTVTASFGKDQAKLADRFAAFVKTFDAPIDLVQQRDINHQTMLAFLREQLREGHEVPLPLFGAMVQTFAKLTRSK